MRRFDLNLFDFSAISMRHKRNVLFFCCQIDPDCNTGHARDIILFGNPRHLATVGGVSTSTSLRFDLDTGFPCRVNAGHFVPSGLFAAVI
jgi:hypothetical protein